MSLRGQRYYSFMYGLRKMGTGLIVAVWMVSASITLLVVTGKYEKAVNSLFPEVQAATTHKENPLRAETFEVDRGDGRTQMVTRFFDRETGFVCYTTDWNTETKLMGRCIEVDGSENRERIRTRYKKD